jgi:transposase InsO family protein
MSMQYDESSLKTRFSISKQRIKRIKADRHWLSLPTVLQELFLNAFKIFDDKALSELTGLSELIFPRWRSEQQEFLNLKQEISKYVKDRIIILKIPTALKIKICKLVSFAKVRKISIECGICKSSLTNWINKGYGKDEKTTAIEQPLQLESVVSIDTSLASIEDDSLGLQLSHTLKRHKNKISRKYSTSEKKLIVQLVEKYGSKVVKDKYGISYDTIARLKRRSANDGNVEQKRRVPMRYIPVLEIMKKHPGMGPMQIRDYLHRHMNLSMGVNSIRRIMEDNGWIPPYVKRSVVKENFQFYEAARKNYLWHMDFKHQWINKSKVYILFIQDDYSRFIVGFMACDGERIDEVVTAVDEAIRIYGKPECIMSDGGSAFFSWRGISQFTRVLEDYGIEQMIAKTPNVNGKLENLNMQVEKELILPTSFASTQHFISEITKWVAFYNFARVHQGLPKSQVPADRYFPGAKQWYGDVSENIKQQSLIAETMATHT